MNREVSFCFLHTSSFLLQKLEGLKPQDKTQITMIVIWVIELFLNQLGTLRDEAKEKTSEYASLQKELDSFLTRPEVMVRSEYVPDMIAWESGTGIFIWI
jgi:hypothetical protein